MKKHTAIWLQAKGLTGYEPYIPCEGGCGSTVVDVHHCESRGMGGRKSMDREDNLVGLCRQCHDKAHRDKEFNEMLKQIARTR